MDRWKAEVGRVREEKRREKKRREEKKKEDHKRESLRRKKIQVCEKVGKSQNTVFFQWFVAPEGRKVGLLKRRAEPAGQMRDEKLHAVVAQSTFASEKAKSTSRSEHFLKLRCRKVYGVVARSTFRSQNVQNTPGSDHFWKFRCRKSARGCGAKHISKSECTKHTRFGALFEVAMSKKCTPFWREAHFEVKMYKTHQVGTTFGSWDVEKVLLWRNAHFEVKMWKTPHARTTFGRSDVVSRGRRTGLCTLSKVSKTCGFCSISKKRWQAWDIGRGSAKMHFPRQAQYKRHVHQRC